MTDPNDWSDIDNVFNEIRRLNGGTLSLGAQELIKGQRKINRRLYNALNEILEHLEPATRGAAPAKSVADIRLGLQKVPGEQPPGCENPPKG